MNWSDFIALISITTVTIVTPGPDFLVVVRNTISRKRIGGIKTAFGVSTAIWIHIAYSILVVKLATSHSSLLMGLLKYMGACYLLYLGIGAIRSSSSGSNELERPNMSKTGYWKQGFLNNLLNPKATLFFLSVFSQLLDPNSEVLILLGCGLLITIICLGWFSLIPILLTTPKTEPLLTRLMAPFERIAGWIFIMYSLKVILT